MAILVAIFRHEVSDEEKFRALAISHKGKEETVARKELRFKFSTNVCADAFLVELNKLTSSFDYYVIAA